MTTVTLTDDERRDLLQVARTARERAYAPFSEFAVGAALRSTAGHVHPGCNVENGSYGLTICAERVAVGAAVVAGEREFDVIAIVTEGGVSPCGACRQVLAEFSPDLLVVMEDATTGAIREATIDELLPMRFDGPSEINGDET